MSYSDIFSYIVAYLEPYATLAYSDPCHIQNLDIFRTQDLFRTLQRHIDIENPAIFNNIQLPYLGIFWYIQSYSLLVVIITLTFFFQLQFKSRLFGLHGFFCVFQEVNFS